MRIKSSFFKFLKNIYIYQTKEQFSVQIIEEDFPIPGLTLLGVLQTLHEEQKSSTLNPKLNRVRLAATKTNHNKNTQQLHHKQCPSQ
jgi:hypothetical protein